MKRLIHTLVLAAAGLTVISAFGCGNASSPGSVSVGQRGALKVTAQWPAARAAQSRLIPALATAILVSVTTDDGTVVGGATLTRPAAGVNTTSATIDQIPVGHVTVTATALPNPDPNYAGNTPQATGSVSATVVYNQVVTTPTLVMNSTITKLIVTPPAATVSAGGASLALSVSAEDKDGDVVLTPASNFTWSSDNSASATVTRTGASATLQGVKVGTARVTVNESDSNVTSAAVAVTVTAGVTNSAPVILIADYGNNRIVGLDAIPPTKTQTYNDSISGKAFSSVAGMAYDSTGRIYVGDNYLGIVRVDDFAGTNRIAYAPTGIAVDAVCVDKAGKIYWTDSNATVNRIDDMTGKNHITFGNRTTLGYNLNSIAVDSLNRVYTFGSQVVRITDITNSSTASPNVTVFGGAGTATNQFSGYGGLAVDSSNKIYIADSGNSRIVRIDDMTGLNWTEFDVPKDAGTAVFPISVAVGSSATSSIYFLANASSVYKMTDMKGTGLTQLGTLTNGITALNSASAISVK